MLRKWQVSLSSMMFQAAPVHRKRLIAVVSWPMRQKWELS